MFRYKVYIRRALEAQKDLELKEAEVTAVLTDSGSAIGVRTQSGEDLYAKTIVLTPGTFLNGLIHIGLTHFPSGRMGDPPS
jgi:tRNA uridine 5-carboxymethylaminomethyl modification enzyme